jgi:hypothetical protein
MGARDLAAIRRKDAYGLASRCSVLRDFMFARRCAGRGGERRQDADSNADIILEMTETGSRSKGPEYTNSSLLVTMEPDLTQERRQAHALLDMLPAEKLNAVRSLLEVMVEPLSRSLALAPVEEEEITPETAAALDRARASLARGEGIPHEEILREFGLGQ